MARRVYEQTFRSTFKVVDKETLSWFPGHMNRGLKQMQNKLKTVDCVVEVHDARIPFSGRNGDFKYTIRGVKPHILVFNKVDLIDKRSIPKITERVKEDCRNVVFTNCKDHSCRGVKKLFPMAQGLIKNSDRFNRTDSEDFCIMVIGIPNVGKSSLINNLRNRFLGKAKATAVGADPGVTKSVLTRIKLSENPPFYLLDTPGILTPSIPSTEIGLKLALCATINNHKVGENIIADYLLYWLNKHEYFSYVDYFKLAKPSDNIAEVLAQIATNGKKFLKFKDVTDRQYVIRPDLDAAAKTMVQAFRDGKLEKVVLDEDIMTQN